MSSSTGFSAVGAGAAPPAAEAAGLAVSLLNLSLIHICSAFVDSLTGAYSRQYFECFLAESEQVEGVVMIDVDHFKEVNDRCV